MPDSPQQWLMAPSGAAGPSGPLELASKRAIARDPLSHREQIAEEPEGHWSVVMKD